MVYLFSSYSTKYMSQHLWKKCLILKANCPMSSFTPLSRDQQHDDLLVETRSPKNIMTHSNMAPEKILLAKRVVKNWR